MASFTTLLNVGEKESSAILLVTVIAAIGLNFVVQPKEDILVCEHGSGFSAEENIFRVWPPLFVVAFVAAFEQLSSSSNVPNIGTANFMYGVSWILLCIWWYVVSQKSLFATFFSAMTMFIISMLCMTTTLIAGLFKANVTKIWGRWFTAIAYSSLAGWSFLVSVVNIMMAYNVNYEVNDGVECDESLNPIPITLSVAVSALGIYFCDPVIIIATLWTMWNLNSYSFQIISLLICFLGTVVSAVRFLNVLYA